jgi:hypothetical protein
MEGPVTILTEYHDTPRPTSSLKSVATPNRSRRGPDQNAMRSESIGMDEAPTKLKAKTFAGRPGLFRTYIFFDFPRSNISR